MKSIISIGFLLFFLSGQVPGDFSLNRFDSQIIYDEITYSGLNSNSIRHIRVGDDENIMFMATSGGLGFADTYDLNVNMRSFDADSVSMPLGGNPGLAVKGLDMAVSGVVQVEAAGSVEPAGTGVSYSSDGGLTWAYKPQPVDPADSPLIMEIEWGGQDISRLAVTTEINNVSYDLTIMGDYVYATSWAGGLQRFRFKNIPPGEGGDDPNPWQPIPLPMDADLEQICGDIPDDFELNPRDPSDGGSHNHKGFSVYAVEDTLWVGTAGGINKGIVSANGECINWRHYNALQDGFTGNWVIGFNHQILEDDSGEEFIRLWAITWSTGGLESYGLSFTDDGGSTWNSVEQFEQLNLQIFGLYSYEINSCESRVLIASEFGLYITEDGLHWEKMSHPLETSGEIIYSESFFACSYQPSYNRIWVGTSDGVAYTSDLGISWEVVRFWVPVVDVSDEDDRFYAYPNPFYSNSVNSFNGENFARFVFHADANANAKVSIFDFAMEKVIDLDQLVPADSDFEIHWNCRNDWGAKVANGVYFCRLDTGNDTYWTKLMVINN